MAFFDRLYHAWNAFNNRDPTVSYYEAGSSFRPDRPKLASRNERSMITTIFNRIALDCASIDIRHVKLDENGRFLREMNSGLNSCLSLEANIDQTARSFMHDAVLSMFDEGSVALIPIDTTLDPFETGSFDVLSLRAGKILQWYPSKVKVRVYNERTGLHEDIFVDKKFVAIIENPFYSVMNEPNSTLQRLIRKLNLLDAIDEQSSSGKLDLIIQLPYQLKSELRKNEAKKRKAEIEEQLTNSKYGIAYIDSTEHVTQLNRAVDNNLMNQIEYLTTMLYGQLGMTTSILDGTADEKTMLNYTNRIISVIISAFAEEMKRKFLTKTARSQMQTIMFFNDPFKLVPINNIAEIADKFTRNEIMSSNEIRQIVGLKPINDPAADELRNKNLNVARGQRYATTSGEEEEEISYDV